MLSLCCLFHSNQQDVMSMRSYWTCDCRQHRLESRSSAGNGCISSLHDHVRESSSKLTNDKVSIRVWRLTDLGVCVCAHRHEMPEVPPTLGRCKHKQLTMHLPVIFCEPHTPGLAWQQPLWSRLAVEESSALPLRLELQKFVAAL